MLAVSVILWVTYVFVAKRLSYVHTRTIMPCTKVHIKFSWLFQKLQKWNPLKIFHYTILRLHTKELALCLLWFMQVRKMWYLIHNNLKVVTRNYFMDIKSPLNCTLQYHVCTLYNCNICTHHRIISCAYHMVVISLSYTYYSMLQTLNFAWQYLRFLVYRCSSLK